MKEFKMLTTRKPREEAAAKSISVERKQRGKSAI